MSLKMLTGKIKILLKSLPQQLAKYGFFFFLSLLFFSLLLSTFLFYKYYVLTEKKEVEGLPSLVKLEEKTINQVLKTWQQREKQFQKVDLKIYLNPFQEERSQQNMAQGPEKKIRETEELSQKETMKGEPALEIQKLLKASNLFQFYLLQGKFLPGLDKRAELWQKKGLGNKEEYRGSEIQNNQLLRALQEELTK